MVLVKEEENTEDRLSGDISRYPYIIFNLSIWIIIKPSESIILFTVEPYQYDISNNNYEKNKIMNKK